MPRLQTRPIRFLFALSLGLLMAGAGCARMLGARGLSFTSPDGTTFHEIAVGNDERTFLLHRPAGLRATGNPMPLLFILHGTSANANQAMAESRMNRVADSVGALVVYPNGTGGIPYFRLFWNTDHCCTGQSRKNVDEVAMVRTIVDSLARVFPVDRRRIGLAGFSDAGTMAYLLACDEPDVLSAIGVVSGELPASNCAPRSGVSTIVFHGTADRNIRYGRTAEAVSEWAGRERCGGARTDTLPGVIRVDWVNCLGGAVVQLNTIIDGRHAWPGGERSWFLAPRPSRSIDASRAFAAFVIQHPRAE